ncbi:MAG: phosphoenolpyruvate--protein phosphotransferase [Firmicutes bacterium]|nr:phosphoenolpyruvate--protein phosphotransferase [Bacillota bacterium]
MNIWRGKAVCEGLAIGTACVYRRTKKDVVKRHIEDFAEEAAKYDAVKNLAIDELERLFFKARDEIGEKEAQIFSIHKMMVEDTYYNESVLNIIEKQKVNAETAVLMTSDSFEKLFHDMDNAYMRERASDVRDISDRIIALLGGKSCPYPNAAAENTIVFADNIAPSEALQMDKTRISAFVTEGGSATSHTAVLARSLGIPAVCRISINSDIDGRRVAVDGYEGVVYIEPDDELIERLTKKYKKRVQGDKVSKAVQGKGKGVKVTADISSPEEVKSAMINDCDGVGIFRSEALYETAKTFPGESFQFDAYRKILEGMNKKVVRVRTLDINEEKKGDFFGIFGEKNPSMGMRSIRICLKRPEIFRTQLRAILKASVCGNIQILLPMIVSQEEVKEAKRHLEEAKAELKEKGISFDENISVGVIIETPAGAVISDEMAKVADFFLIDADNLASYMLAMDIQNPAICDIMDIRHKSVLKMIETAVKNAHKNGITAGLCGKLAKDKKMLPELLKMGIDEFSVNPKNVSFLRKLLCESK